MNILFIYEKKYGVTAIFVDEYHYSPKEKLYTCYQHVGQHSECTKEWLEGKKLATYNQYKDLLKELIEIGYEPDDLEVI